MSVGPSVRNQPYVCQSIHMNTVISETIKAAILEYSITFKHDYTEKIKTFSNRVFIPVTLRVKGYIISVTRRVKGYARFVGKHVTGRRKRFRPGRKRFCLPVTYFPSNLVVYSTSNGYSSFGIENLSLN